MSDKIKELLAVLDLPEDEQFLWVYEHITYEKYECHQCGGQDTSAETLADLAFRLRDEVCKVSCEDYYSGLEAVYNHRHAKKYISFYAFWTYQSKPIDMIIAALIAKELNK